MWTTGGSPDLGREVGKKPVQATSTFKKVSGLFNCFGSDFRI